MKTLLRILTACVAAIVVACSGLVPANATTTRASLDHYWSDPVILNVGVPRKMPVVHTQIAAVAAVVKVVGSNCLTTGSISVTIKAFTAATPSHRWLSTTMSQRTVLQCGDTETEILPYSQNLGGPVSTKSSPARKVMIGRRVSGSATWLVITRVYGEVTKFYWITIPTLFVLPSRR